jgi:hypothetical protein
MTTTVSVTPTYYTKRGGWCSADPLQYHVTVRTVTREITFKPRPLWTGEEEVMYTQKSIPVGTEVALVTLARGGHDMMLVKPRAALAGDWQSADIYTNLGKCPEHIAKFLADHFEDASHV